MANLFGALGIADSERAFTSIQGQEIIWQETQRVFERWNMDSQAARSLFVVGDTTNHKERFELPGGGQLQIEDESTGAHESASVKRAGSWDVAYPLFQAGASLSYDEVGLRYLTMGAYEVNIQTILNQANNLLFARILTALFKNTNTAYTDKIYGALTLVPLANQDGTVYPPVYGATAEAQENFYLATSYAESAISNANNPFITIRGKLEPHYGFPQGGSPIVTLVNSSTVPYARALADFDELPDYQVVPGANVTLLNLPELPVLPAGMRIVGRCDSNTIVEWPRMPAGYMISIHSQAPKPLKRRIDPADTGLTAGLTPWNETVGEPYKTTRYRIREGYAVGNRLGAVVTYLNGSGTYAAPTGFTKLM